MNLSKVSQGDFYKDWASANGGQTYWMPGTKDNVEGTLTAAAVSILGGSAGGPTDSGTLAILEFTALSAGGNSDLTLSNIIVGDIYSKEISGVTATNGQVIITQCGGAPGVPASPSPANASNGVSVETDLDWGDAANTTYYQVYFSTNAGSLTLKGSPNTSSLALPTLNHSTTYYWQVVAMGCGGSTNGSVWSFTTAANTSASTPTPTPSPSPTPAPTESKSYRAPGTGTVSPSGGVVRIDNVTLIFPPGAVAVDTVITVEKGTEPGSFSITASSGGVPFSTLGCYILMCVQYTDDDVQAAGGSADRLKLAYFDDDTVKWVELDTKVNKEQKTVCAYTNHLSEWSILGGSSNSSAPLWFWYLVGGCGALLVIAAAALTVYRMKLRRAYAGDEELDVNETGIEDADDNWDINEKSGKGTLETRTGYIYSANRVFARSRGSSADYSTSKSALCKYHFVTERARITIESEEGDITVSSKNHDAEDEIIIAIQRNGSNPG